MEKITEYLIRSTVNTPGEVRAWQEEIVLPTYEIGAEEKTLSSLRNVFTRVVAGRYILILL